MWGSSSTNYYVKAVDEADQETCSDTIVVPGGERQGKIYANNMPSSFELGDNFPNPFNSQTSIEYSLPEAAHVTIVIYDLLGRNIETLIDEHKQPGYHQATWDAKNVSSGMYLYRIQARDFSETKKMLLLK
jgi:hypothetical protein